MRSTFGPLAVALHLLLGGLAPSAGPILSGQEVIYSDPACEGCQISASPVWTLGRDTHPDGLLFGTPLQLSRLQNGEILLLSEDGGAPQVFGPDGKFLRRLGGRGQGPMEFIRPALAKSIPGDSVLILDPGLGRATVVSVDGDARTVGGLPTIYALEVLQWPKVVSFGDIRTPDRISQPFHIMDFGGHQVVTSRTFGAEEEEFLPWERLDGWALSRASDTAFWAIGGTGYTIELWAVAGSREYVVRRALDEYGGPSRYGIGNPRSPPPSRVIDSQIDDDGRLWVFLLVPRFDWARAWDGVRIDEHGGVALSEAPDLLTDLYQTRIDLIDTGTRRLLATRTFTGMVVPSDGFRLPTLARFSIEADGTPVLEVSELTLATAWPTDDEDEARMGG
jgi:hypothetical protein